MNYNLLLERTMCDRKEINESNFQEKTVIQKELIENFVCVCCQKEKPKTESRKHNVNTDIIQVYCKPCHNAIDGFLITRNQKGQRVNDWRGFLKDALVRYNFYKKYGYNKKYYRRG